MIEDDAPDIQKSKAIGEESSINTGYNVNQNNISRGSFSCDKTYMNMTRQLLQALQPKQDQNGQDLESSDNFYAMN